MSKDIRNYFIMKSSSNNEKKPGIIVNTKTKNGPRKRPVVLIDSDSDEELTSATAKRSKSTNIIENKFISKKGEKSENNKKKNENNKESKHFTEEVNVSEMLGNRPVKRDNSRNIVRKVVSKEALEFHLDKDFEAELLKLDESDLRKTVTGEENVHDDNIGIKVDKDNNINKKEKCKTTSKESGLNSVIPEECDSEIPRKKPKLENNSDKFANSEQAKEKHVINPVQLIPSNKDKKAPLKKLSTSENKDSEKVINTSKFFSSKVTPPKKPSLFGESTLSGNKTSPSSSQSTQKPVSIVQNNDKSYKDDLDKIVDTLSSSLWVERYKPQTTKQIIGQQGEKSCVNKLMFWLKNWHSNHSGKKILSKPSPWAKDDNGSYFKAALLSGPPGVGKTTSAHLVSKELGFDIVEFNASDTRSKKLLHQEVSELLSSNSLSPFFTGAGDRVTKKHLLLMDEVDGMAGNEDRGGVQELIQLVKTARVPIICMCNDRNHPKIRSLANYCFDLRFSKPRAEQIKGAMMSLCFKEKLKISPNDLTEIITSANQDIRLVINHLSMLSLEKTGLAHSSKHIKMGPWNFTRKIFSEEEHKTMSIHDKCDLFFHDYNVTPLFVQENYLNAVPHKPEAKNKVRKMELFAKAARSLSLGDLTEKSIRSHNAWGLLPVQAVFSSLIPGDVLEGHIGAQITFPAWFGKNSRQTKMSRLLQELTIHARLRISGNKEAMNLDYLVPLERSIVMPLVTHGVEGISSALTVLNSYSLVREDLESFSELSAWPNSKNMFSEVESKVKSAFTRAYNKTSAPTPYANVPIKKASKNDIEIMDVISEGVEEDSQVQEEEEEDEGVEVDAMITVKKNTSRKKVDKQVPSTSKGPKNSKRGRKK